MQEGACECVYMSCSSMSVGFVLFCLNVDSDGSPVLDSQVKDFTGLSFVLSPAAVILRETQRISSYFFENILISSHVFQNFLLTLQRSLCRDRFK